MYKLTKLNQAGFDHVLAIVVFVVIFALAGTFLLIQSHAASWSGALQLGYDKGLCLNDNNSSKANGTTIGIYTCQNAVSEKWTIAKYSNGQFQLKNGQGICADDWGAGVSTSTTKVYLKTYACQTNNGSEFWIWNGHELENAYSKGCINDPAYSKTNSTGLIIWPCAGSYGNEQWFEAALGSSGGTSTGGGSNSGGGGSSTSTSGGCTSGGVVAPCIGGPTTGASGWGKPVFDDEFTGTSLNTKYWATSWFNGGKVNSNGVVMNSSNVAVSGGDLVLTLASSSSGATIDTDPAQDSGGSGFTFGDGYFDEGRIYIPGNGSSVDNWPAFWTDGQSWPTDGEIDILEGLGSATSNYHSPQGASNSGTIAGTWANGWHTYAVDRESGKNTIYWDGKAVRSYSTDDGGAPEYLIMSLDCSGGCTTGTASQVKVDYVRVWKKS